MSQLADTDDWMAVIEKILRKKKLEKPDPMSIWNPRAMRVVWCYPYLLEQDPSCLSSLQSFFRSSYEQAYLVDELCQLTLAMAHILAICKTAKLPPKTAMEALTPLLQILDDKTKYLEAKAEAKRQGLDANATRSAITKLRNASDADAIKKTVYAEKNRRPFKQNGQQQKQKQNRKRHHSSSDSD